MLPQSKLRNPILLAMMLMALGDFHAIAQEAKDSPKPAEATKTEADTKKEEQKAPSDQAEENGKEEPNKDATHPKDVDPDDEAAVEAAEEEAAAVAKPVPSDPVQVYGWKERVLIEGLEKSIYAKLDTGAITSSIHAEEKELFERDGKKWVRFILTEPRKKDSPRTKVEAPLIRIARIKNPGAESESREVVRLSFKIGDRKLRGDFTLNNRSNMLSAILIGRTTIKELGWIDSTRINLADKKIMR